LNYLAKNIEEMFGYDKEEKVLGVSVDNPNKVELKILGSVAGDNMLDFEVNDLRADTPNILGNEENMSRSIANMLGTWGNETETDYVKLFGNKDTDDWCRHGLYVVRRHAKARKEFFTPRRVQGSPPCRSLSAMRVTIGTFIDGEAFKRVDAWTTRSTAHEQLSRPWRGCTIFLLKTA
jgi:hypothetical protein